MFSFLHRDCTEHEKGIVSLWIWEGEKIYYLAWYITFQNPLFPPITDIFAIDI